MKKTSAAFRASKHLILLFFMNGSFETFSCAQAPDCPAPDPEKLKQQLSAIQWKVTKENGTEPPFQNPLYNEHRRGIYVSIVTGKALFSSNDKFDSGTGWPSFFRPIQPGVLKEVVDSSHGMTRTEVRTADDHSHLGHVFTDGPKPTGLRYCINAAALRFIPLEDLEKEGYAEFKKLFQ